MTMINKTKNTVKRNLISLALIFVLVSPHSLLAQTSSSTEPEVTLTQVSEDIPTESLPQVDLDLTQVTSSTQEAIQGQVLEETINPQEGNTQPEATTTTEVIVEESEDQTPISQIVEVQVQQTQQTQTLPVQVTITQVMQVDEIEREELKPKQEYTLALDGSALTTTEEVKDGKDKKITDVPLTSLDSEESILTVSGSCDDPYYVVLIYKDEKDYSSNRSSYIFNKAFDCTNGQYSYSISELPPDLDNGRYYLLVGGQGNEGTWRPISAMVPITINKKNESR